MKICVTGGAGFIGSHLVDELIEKNNDVFVIDNLSTGNRGNINSKAKFYYNDVRSCKIENIFVVEKPDYVYHLAAQMNVRKSLENAIKDCEINILGSLNILNNCVNYKIKKVIFSSSGGAVYGEQDIIPIKEVKELNPISPYGISKMAVESYLKFYKNNFGLKSVILRYANVYGERQNSKGEAGIVSIFTEKYLKKNQIQINGDGMQTRDYIYIQDITSANMLSINLEGVYNVGTGVETNVNDIAFYIENKLNVNSNRIYGTVIKGELIRNSLDVSKLRKENWKIKYSLEDGLSNTINYIKKLNI